MNMEIANHLVELRRARGLSQEELAAKLGVSRQAVSKWERCESSPDTDNLIALARLYGISLDALLLHGGYSGGAAGGQAVAYDTYAEEEDEEDAVFAAAEAWDAAEDENREVRRKHLKKKLMFFPYPVFLPFFYVLLGVGFGLWHPGWIIFLTIPLYYALVETLL